MLTWFSLSGMVDGLGNFTSQIVDGRDISQRFDTKMVRIAVMAEILRLPIFFGGYPPVSHPITTAHDSNHAPKCGT